MKKHILPI